jgi:hypothetical protein
MTVTLTPDLLDWIEEVGGYSVRSTPFGAELVHSSGAALSRADLARLRTFLESRKRDAVRLSSAIVTEVKKP